MTHVRKSTLLLIVGFLAIIALALFSAPVTAEAAKYTSPKPIKTGTIKKIDINGGSKEKVQFTVKKVDKAPNGEYFPGGFYKTSLKINGKTKDTKYSFSADPAPKLFYTDINKKDKYKELVVRTYLSQGEFLGKYSYVIFRYSGGKLKLLKTAYYYSPPARYDYYGSEKTKYEYIYGDRIRFDGKGRFQVLVEYSRTPQKHIWLSFKVDSKMKATRI